MKKYISLIIFVLYFPCHSKSQVNTQDSLALVDLYYSLNGPNWANQNNWLTGPVKTWSGITLNYPDSNRVTAINMGGSDVSGQLPNSIGDLSELLNFRITGSNLTGNFPHTIGRLKKCRMLHFYYNQMTGQLTDSLGEMTELQALVIYNNNLAGSVPASLATLNHFYSLLFENNHIEGLPDFSQAPQSTMYFELRVFNNNLTFEDFEPNMTLNTFNCSICTQQYVPQFDSINNTIDTTMEEHSAFEMHCSIGGQHNVYQWTKDTVDIPLAIDSVLALNNVVLGDSGVYACRVTNTIVPGLTYYRRPITLHVDKVTESFSDYLEPLNNLKLSPNPTSNTLNIESSTKYSQLVISDILGKVVIRQQFYNTAVRVDVSGLGKGLYFVKLFSENRVVVKKFLKE